MGFTTVGMVLGEGDTIAHAELKLGSSMYLSHIWRFRQDLGPDVS